MPDSDTFERLRYFDAEPDDAPVDEDEPIPTQADLDEHARNRIRRFIIQSALFGGATGEAVAGLYADLAEDARAGRYLDGRFLLRRMPPDWREVEDAVLDLAHAAFERGVDLPLVWRRAQEIAKEQHDADPMDVLARLAGVEVGRRRTRSMFDDPEDLDEQEDEWDADDAERLGPLPDRRNPELRDLTAAAQESIRFFVLEERLERGLPPAELMELYRRFDVEGDERARDYLDRVYVEGDVPLDWETMQHQADEVWELADRHGKDAGRLFSAARRRAGGLSALEVLRLVRDELR